MFPDSAKKTLGLPLLKSELFSTSPVTLKRIINSFFEEINFILFFIIFSLFGVFMCTVNMVVTVTDHFKLWTIQLVS